MPAVPRCTYFALLLCLWLTALCIAGGTNAVADGLDADSPSVFGVVVDPSGDRVAGATIQVETGTGMVLHSAISDDQGEFAVPAAAAAGLQLLVRKPGFSDTRIALPGTNPTVPLTVTLPVGVISTDVTVSAESIGVQPVVNTPQQVNVLREETLRQTAYWNASAAAAEQPGVAIQQTSPTIGGIYIRGMSGDDVPVFIDGVRASTSAARGGISTFLNLNDVSNLESMELLRGPNTAQYGSDSLGGVIAMASQRPTLRAGRKETRVQWGSAYESAMHAFGSDLSLSHARETAGFVLNAQGRRVNTLRTGGGIDSHSSLTRFLGLPSTVLYERLPDTAFTQYGAMLHGQWNATQGSQFVLHYQRGQQDGGKRFDQLLGGDGNLVADLRNLMADLAYLRYHAFPTRVLDQISVTGSYVAQREERRNQGGQGNPESPIRSEFERTSVWGFSGVAGRTLGAMDLSFGGDVYRERLRAFGYSVNPASGEEERIRARIPDRARYLQSGVFGQVSWRPWSERLRLAGAIRLHRASYEVRAEDAPVVGGEPLFAPDSLTAVNVSGRLGAVLRLVSALRARAYYSRGFRAPTVTNLGTLGLTGNGFEVGSAEIGGLGGEIGSTAGEDALGTGAAVSPLRPELSDNFDLGLSWETRRLRLDITGFQIDRDNVIAKRALVLPQGAVGLTLADQPIVRQEASGIVFVPLVPNPVLVRTNADAARFRGLEGTARWQLSRTWMLRGGLSYVRAEDLATGAPPDISSGVPAPNAFVAFRFSPARGRHWVELAADGWDRQGRISSVGIADRRVGATRTRTSIARFFQNGARVRGLIQPGADGIHGTTDDLLAPTGETLSEVQTRVLGSASAAPLFDAIPGYLLLHLRAGFRVGESHRLFAAIENITDRNYRGMAWGVDGPGRSLVLQWRMSF